MNGINPSFFSIGQVQDTYLGNGNARSTTATNVDESFAGLLQKAQNTKEGVKFSKHAQARLSERNIEMTQDQIERLNQGMAQAGQKGINESLILVDQLAFIVNVPNSTVVTAMSQTEENSNKVFTNIDGAVIA